MEKKLLRIKYKTLRAELSETDIGRKSLAIANSLFRLPIWSGTYFHVFLPIVEKHEVDTEFILHLLSGKDKEIVVSKSDFSTGQMSHFLLTDNTRIVRNEYGIPEPANGINVPAEKIDVVFVPLLAFDKTGHRVGYGKGFYDRFLAECRKDVIKVGLSFFEAEETVGEVFESDVKLSFCVTPETTYEFSPDRAGIA